MKQYTLMLVLSSVAFAQNTPYQPPVKQPQYVVQVKPMGASLEFTFGSTPYRVHCRQQGTLTIEQPNQKQTMTTKALIYDGSNNKLQLHKQIPNHTDNQLRIYCEVNNIRFDPGRNVLVVQKN